MPPPRKDIGSAWARAEEAMALAVQPIVSNQLAAIEASLDVIEGLGIDDGDDFFNAVQIRTAAQAWRKRIQQKTIEEKLR